MARAPRLPQGGPPSDAPDEPDPDADGGAVLDAEGQTRGVCNDEAADRLADEAMDAEPGRRTSG